MYFGKDSFRFRQESLKFSLGQSEPYRTPVLISLVLSLCSSAAVAGTTYKDSFSQLKTDFHSLTTSLSCTGSSCMVDGDLDLESTSPPYDGLRLHVTGPTSGVNAILSLQSGTVNFRTSEETYVRAGYSESSGTDAVAEANSVVVGGSSTLPDITARRIYVGHAKVLSGTGSNTAKTTNNSFSMESGYLYAEKVIGGYSESTDNAVASGNTVSFTGGTIGCTTASTLLYVYGGYALSSASYGSSVNASGNTVSLENVTVSPVNSLFNTVLVGGYAEDSNDNICVNNNRIIANNVDLSAVSFDVNSAWLHIDDYGKAEENTVYLGTLENTGSVTVRLVRIMNGDSSCTVDATGNSLYLYGDSDLSNGSSALYGLYVAPGAVSNTVNSSLTTLYLGYGGTPWSSSNYTINSVAGFNTIKFNNAVWGKTISLASFAGSMDSGGNYSGVTSVDASTVAFSGTAALHEGDSYSMLKVNTVSSGSLGLVSTASTYTIGTAVEGEGTVSLSDSDNDGKYDTVTYTINPSDDSDDDIDPAPQTHTAVMASSAATLTLNQGADNLSRAAENLMDSKVSGIQAFSSVGGGALRARTGSHINLYSLNLAAGAGTKKENEYGVFAFGGAFEAGYARFKNHYDARSADPYVKKSGNVSYYGVAALAGLQLTNLWHFDMSVRAGRVFTTQREALYDVGRGIKYNADINSHYFGAELGLGKILRLSDADSLDFFARYYYLYQSADDFNAGTDRYQVKSIQSHRLRLVGRYQHDLSKESYIYASLGVEREFDGRSELKINSPVGTVSANPSKIDGTRALCEFGFKVGPSDSGINFDLGIKGLYGNGFRGIFAGSELNFVF